ncbi:hypothetical protein SBC1_61740 (plasmid) [Caballeronia sp. SBC1]|nr:hypothetical protein SBC2_61390 [Caballeronia sp. SBC2]QIN66127.1 hypothetical protein SBC1_61740 [Caballeronia sp. SBC1]
MGALRLLETSRSGVCKPQFHRLAQSPMKPSSPLKAGFDKQRLFPRVTQIHNCQINLNIDYKEVYNVSSHPLPNLWLFVGSKLSSSSCHFILAEPLALSHIQFSHPFTAASQPVPLF